MFVRVGGQTFGKPIPRHASVVQFGIHHFNRGREYRHMAKQHNNGFVRIGSPRSQKRPRLRLIPRRTTKLRAFETLEQRAMLAVTAVFTPSSGVLSVFGDSADNTIVVSRDAAGKIQVNDGAINVNGGTPTVVNTGLIQVFGLSGSDNISLNEANGNMPRAFLYGGDGDDTLAGGSGADRLFGQAGIDTLVGKVGDDILFGGAAADSLTGGDGDDQSFGQNDNDRLIWNPGDDTDLVEGGAGVDTVEINGGNGAETFTTTANGTRVRFDRIDPAPFALDIGATEMLVLSANGGNDNFSATGNLLPLIQITVDGGAGNDTIVGSNGGDVLRGGDDADFIDGQQGNDFAFLGAGDDTFQWDPGDGLDIVEGEAGSDTAIFNGSGSNELIDISANGDRTRFTRNIGSIVTDLNDVEQVNYNALGGTDTITINDLAGTDVVAVNINLAGTIGGTAGDGQVDSVVINGTAANDAMVVNGNAGSASILGLAAVINIANAEAPTDRLIVNLLAGDDVFDASGLTATGIGLVVDGGDNDDTITGGEGADTLLGGNGDDILIGGLGNDTLDGGLGDNILIQ